MRFEFSAGGVVFKKERGKTYVLLCKHSQYHKWVFPKGLIGDTPSTRSGQARKESKEDTALREVREETGAIGKILKSLTPVQYWFQFQNEKIKKTVYYFLMAYVGGDITKHDHEMEEVEWVDEEEVVDRLDFAADKKVWQEARRLIVSGR